jgi:hypothetical protein
LAAVVVCLLLLPLPLLLLIVPLLLLLAPIIFLAVDFCLALLLSSSSSSVLCFIICVWPFAVDVAVGYSSLPHTHIHTPLLQNTS